MPQFGSGTEQCQFGRTMGGVSIRGMPAGPLSCPLSRSDRPQTAAARGITSDRGRGGDLGPAAAPALIRRRQIVILSERLDFCFIGAEAADQM